MVLIQTVAQCTHSLPSLDGLYFYAQWFIDDDVAAGGIAATAGSEFVMF